MLNKYILAICLMVLFSVCATAQIGTRYILRSGDTTLVVNNTNYGLKDKKSKFLHRDNSFTNMSVNFMDMTSNYRSLEEARFATDTSLVKLEEIQSDLFEPNESLSARISQGYIKLGFREREARLKADSMERAKIKLSTDQLAAQYEKFGTKPTLYVNDVEVPQSIVDRLKAKEILNRKVKVLDTRTGNPNGEIYYEVTPTAIRRLDIKEDD